MKVEPVVDERALVVENTEKTLVIADIHIGIECELMELGIRIPSQLPSILDRVKRILREREVDRIVIVGDVKHSITHPPYHERKDVEHFLRELVDYAPVDIALGNHDGGLANMIPEDIRDSVSIHPSSGFVHDSVGYFHGHAWMDKSLLEGELLVCGHNHPHVSFVDSLGCTITLPCWIRTLVDVKDLQEYSGLCSEIPLIVAPAFCTLSKGISFNDPETKPLGPIFSVVNLDDAKCYLLDGTYLGTIKELKKFSKPENLMSREEQ